MVQDSQASTHLTVHHRFGHADLRTAQKIRVSSISVSFRAPPLEPHRNREVLGFEPRHNRIWERVDENRQNRIRNTVFSSDGAVGRGGFAN
jgi:hypothetical protein